MIERQLSGWIAILAASIFLGSGAMAEPQRASKPCFNVINHGHCPHGDECWYSHDQKVLDQARSARPCHRFVSTGECRHGRNCRYSHDSKLHAKKHQICFFHFFGSDGCRSGAACPRNHLRNSWEREQWDRVMFTRYLRGGSILGYDEFAELISRAALPDESFDDLVDRIRAFRRLVLRHSR